MFFFLKKVTSGTWSEGTASRSQKNFAEKNPNQGSAAVPVRTAESARRPLLAGSCSLPSRGEPRPVGKNLWSAQRNENQQISQKVILTARPRVGTVQNSLGLRWSNSFYKSPVGRFSSSYLIQMLLTSSRERMYEDVLLTRT